jgi:hypothetical protein
VWVAQLGTTKMSCCSQRSTVSPTRVSPSPSTQTNTVPSVARYGSEANPVGSSCTNVAIVGIANSPLAGFT